MILHTSRNNVIFRLKFCSAQQKTLILQLHQNYMNIKNINYRTVSIVTLLVVILFQLSWMLYTYNKTFCQLKLEARFIINQTATEWEREKQSGNLHDKMSKALETVGVRSLLKLDTVNLNVDDEDHFPFGCMFVVRSRTSVGQNLACSLPYIWLDVIGQMWMLAVVSILTCVALVSILMEQLSIMERQRALADFRYDFTYAMVHGMKTPLSSIIMGIKQLHSGKLDGRMEVKQRCFDIVEDEAQHLLNLVNRMLTLSKLENRNLVLNEQLVNLEPMLTDLLNKAKSRTTKTFACTLDLQHKTVWGDEEYLREVFANLIDNAAKYAKKDIRIHIRSMVKDQQVTLTIKDWGIGIAKEDLPYVFDKFRRSTCKASAYKVQGFGLGLNYVQQVVKVHGGNVSVKSIQDEYTEFAIKLPYRQ